MGHAMGRSAAHPGAGAPPPEAIEVNGSGGRLCHLANCGNLPAWTRSLIPRSSKINSAYIPDHGNCPVDRSHVQGMARARSGQAPAGPWFLTECP